MSLSRVCRHLVPSVYLFDLFGRVYFPRNEVSGGKEPLDLVLGSDAGSFVLPPARHRRDMWPKH